MNDMENSVSSNDNVHTLTYYTDYIHSHTLT